LTERHIRKEGNRQKPGSGSEADQRKCAIQGKSSKNKGYVRSELKAMEERGFHNLEKQQVREKRGYWELESL